MKRLDRPRARPRREGATIRCANYSFSLQLANLADVCLDANRQVQSSRPSRAYSVEGPFRPCGCQASPTLSLSKTGDYSNSASRSVSPPSTIKCVLVTNLQTLRAARFGTHHSRRTRTYLAASTRAGQPIQLERGEPTGANRGASTRSCPPS
jgi:hypothetical protein